MFELRNDELALEVLDPVADAARLGPRYCWGGYIWQVRDHARGPLLTGPEWPAPSPAPFNGQGLPESFRHRTLEGRPLTWDGNEGVALGAGSLGLDERGEPYMVQPCAWTMTRRETTIESTTVHAAAGFVYELRRTIELTGRNIRSATQLHNAPSSRRLLLEWFAHPFFPLVDGAVRAEVPRGTRVNPNSAFELSGRVLTQRRRFQTQSDGHMERDFHLPENRPLLATLAHPTGGSIRFETSFVPDWCIVWGNDRTFSFEPYRSLNLAPGETLAWHLDYRFDADAVN